MATDSTLQSKTLTELRALAKARGLKGYSKLAKEPLLRLLDQPAPEPVTTTSRTKKARAPKKKTAARQQAEPAKAAIVSSAPVIESAAAPAGAAPPPPPAAAVQFPASEEGVERSKYASRPNGGIVSESFADLDEDIDRLPTLNEPVVCLLPQKPGVLHAYWILPPDESGEHVKYKLRLCRDDAGSMAVCEEVPLQAHRGNWYFHVAEGGDTAGLLVQLGYYQDGRFVSARGRSIARLPSLYASTRTDERWWISEADFMRMYLRAGGFSTATHGLGWNASIGSPGGPSPAPEEHLAWPGGVSSSFK